MSVSCGCCMLFCVGLIIPREIVLSLRVSECDHDASIMKRPWQTRGCCIIRKNENNFIIICLMYSAHDFIPRDIYLLMNCI